jgi:hypothetical protein
MNNVDALSRRTADAAAHVAPKAQESPDQIAKLKSIGCSKAIYHLQCDGIPGYN